MLIRVSTSKPSQSTWRYGQAMPPERVVAVAEVGVARAEEQVDERRQAARCRAPDERDVGAAAALPEAGALREVRAGHERLDEARDLGRIGRAVGVEHHDDVAGRSAEPGLQARRPCRGAPRARRRCRAAAHGRRRSCCRSSGRPTRMTSWMSRGMRENTCGRFRASLSVGMTTVTVGADALAATAGPSRRSAAQGSQRSLDPPSAAFRRSQSRSSPPQTSNPDERKPIRAPPVPPEFIKFGVASRATGTVSRR